MTLFYCPTIATATVLSEEESLHAVKVLRLQPGDKIIVVDGIGGYYEAEITIPHHKHCQFKVLKSMSDYGKRNYSLHIAIAPTKNIERLEWFIEKATEIGIDEITPVICRFSERKIVKEDRLEKIIVSASKQSVKAFFPTLHPACSFDDFLKKQSGSQKFIAHCYTSPQPSPEERENANTGLSAKIYDRFFLKNLIKTGSDVIILIGPEGDFSKEEVEKAILNGFIPVSLGKSRLRTETAGVVACHTAAIVNEIS